MSEHKKAKVDGPSAFLQTAIDAAKLAGANMKKYLGKASIEKTKSSKDDLVTVVDKQCQDIVEGKIKEDHPTHDILGEEDVPAGRDAAIKALDALLEKEFLWIVDPIDGTANFVHCRPSSVVSIALVHNGELLVGVVFDPYRDEMFTAEKGRGAYLINSEQEWSTTNARMSVSKEHTFSEALLAFGIGTKPSVRVPMLRCVDKFSEKCRGIRLQGSAAMELAWVASGRETGFYELDLNSWDVAAGVLLVQEAGGKVTDSEGGVYDIRTRHLVSSNGLGDVHSEMLRCIKEAQAADLQAM